VLLQVQRVQRSICALKILAIPLTCNALVHDAGAARFETLVSPSATLACMWDHMVGAVLR